MVLQRLNSNSNKSNCRRKVMKAKLLRIWPENTKPTFKKGEEDKDNSDLLWKTLRDAEEDFRFSTCIRT